MCGLQLYGFAEPTYKLYTHNSRYKKTSLCVTAGLLYGYKYVPWLASVNVELAIVLDGMSPLMALQFFSLQRCYLILKHRAEPTALNPETPPLNRRSLTLLFQNSV